MATWIIGSITVTRIEEQLGFSFPPEQYFMNFEREVLDRHLGWLAPAGTPSCSIAAPGITRSDRGCRDSITWIRRFSSACARPE